MPSLFFITMRGDSLCGAVGMLSGITDPGIVMYCDSIQGAICESIEPSDPSIPMYCESMSAALCEAGVVYDSTATPYSITMYCDSISGSIGNARVFVDMEYRFEFAYFDEWQPQNCGSVMYGWSSSGAQEGQAQQ